MSGTGQFVLVDDIAHDDGKLIEKVVQLVSTASLVSYFAKPIQIGAEVLVDSEETIAKSFDTVDPSVCAILIKKHSAPGAVRLFGDKVVNVVTGPTEVTGYIILIKKPGETCRLLGNPSIRCFRRRW